jgi:tetratricopeptide (TPR) repeat protein
MAEQENDIFGSSGQDEQFGQSQIFGDGVKLDLNTKDLFGGDLSGIRNKPAGSAGTSSAGKPKKRLNLTQAFMIVNLLVLTGVLVYLVKNPRSVIMTPAGVQAQTAQQAQPAVTTPAPAQQAETPSNTISVMDNVAISKHTAEALDEALSLQSAKLLVNQKAYYKACYIYDKLRLNVNGQDLKSQCLRDWLSLQMALCLQKTKEQELMGQHFTQALTSPSIVVRAMANYNLAFIQNHNHQFFEARSRAYQALALLKAFENYMPASMEADCYFIAIESLTREILKMNNLGSELPGPTWADSMTPYELPVINQAQLADLLVVGLNRMNEAVMMPKVDHYPDKKTGTQWSVTCLDAPLEQLFWQYASEADLMMSWESEVSEFRRNKTTVYLPYVDRQYLAEVISATSGLIWRYDGEKGTIYDPANYQDFDVFKDVLVQEAVARWQRFLLHYRNDSRISNAQYCLGQLFAIAKENATALGSYKLVSTQHSESEMAPYALLNASKIKAGLKDYKGARDDLNELLIRYPNCKIVDQALLHLAETTMNSGLFEDAQEMYERAFRMNISRQAQQDASFGLGRCAFETGQYQLAAEWLSKALKMTPNEDDYRLGPACFMLGRSFIELGQFQQATGAFRVALGGTLANREYAQIVLELAEAECKQDNYLQALKFLESIPEERLNQEDSCLILMAKSKIFRSINLPDTSISILRRRIEYIAEAHLRAKLTLELAHAYMLNGDLDIAQKEMNDAMYDLPVGYETQLGGYVLAEIAYRMDQQQKAERLCLQNLQTNIQDEDLRSQVYELLGQIYTKQKDYDKAALAYAGQLEQNVIR